MGNISAGFGRASLIPAFQDGKRFPDTMDTRAFVCRSGKETALIVVADLGCPSQKTVLQLRREVARAVKLPLKSVIHPKRVTATLQSATHRLCATTVARPNRNVMYPVETVIVLSSVY